MSDLPNLEEKRARNREERLRFVREWAEYVRTHPDDDWGEQVNKLVDSQIQSARNAEDDRPDMDRLREESPLLNPDARDEDGEDDAEPADTGG
jgi:hypothetical protein